MFGRKRSNRFIKKKDLNTKRESSRISILFFSSSLVKKQKQRKRKKERKKRKINDKRREKKKIKEKDKRREKKKILERSERATHAIECNRVQALAFTTYLRPIIVSVSSSKLICLFLLN